MARPHLSPRTAPPPARLAPRPGLPSLQQDNLSFQLGPSSLELSQLAPWPGHPSLDTSLEPALQQKAGRGRVGAGRFGGLGLLACLAGLWAAVAGPWAGLLAAAAWEEPLFRVSERFYITSYTCGFVRPAFQNQKPSL